MNKNFPIVIGLFILIIGLAFIVNWQRKNLTESLSGELNFAWEPLDMGEVENFFSAPEEKTQENKEFISPDEKLRISYPADYIEIKDETILEALTHQNWTEKYNLQTLFSAQRIKGNGFSQIIIHKGNFGLSIEEIIEEDKRISKEQGWTIEIISMDIEENEGILKTKHINSSTSFLYAEEKILQFEEETYLISIFYLPESDSTLEQEVDKIIDSAQLAS